MLRAVHRGPWTVSTVDMALRAADLDLTACTRGYGPNTVTLSASLRFSARRYPVATNTARIRLGSVLDVPAASAWGLLSLGAILMGAGLVVLRRSQLRGPWLGCA